MNATDNLKVTESIENTIQKLKNACGTTRGIVHSEIAINQYNVTSMCVHAISTFAGLKVTELE